VTLGGTDHLSASFAAHDIAGQIESGYRLSLSLRWFTPYAAVRVQAFYTPAYGETSDQGASVFALNYNAHTTTDTRTELGARIDRTMALPNGDTLGLRARAAWAHDFWSNTAVVASFQSMPGSSVTVVGATPPADSFLLSGGTEIGFRNGFSVASWVDTAFARGSQSYAGNVRLRYAW
jgi:outer membrane autotransporter protein